MKREIAAAALLLLLILGAVWNLHTADRLMERVEYNLHRAERAARREDYAYARAALSCAKEIWDGKKTYTHIFFRHPDLDDITDAFAGLDQLLLEQDPGWPAALQLLRDHLENVVEMEHVSIGTVF